MSLSESTDLSEKKASFSILFNILFEEALLIRD